MTIKKIGLPYFIAQITGWVLMAVGTLIFCRISLWVWEEIWRSNWKTEITLAFIFLICGVALLYTSKKKNRLIGLSKNNEEKQNEEVRTQL